MSAAWPWTHSGKWLLCLRTNSTSVNASLTFNMIGRYPRYRELWPQYRSKPEDAARLVQRLTNNDLTDLQVLSQIAWMDEFFLQDPDIQELVKKGRGYSADDQQLVVMKQRQFLAKVLPAYAVAAQRGSIEIST